MTWGSIVSAYVVGILLTAALVELSWLAAPVKAKDQAQMSRFAKAHRLPFDGVVLLLGLFWPLGLTLWVFRGEVRQASRDE